MQPPATSLPTVGVVMPTHNRASLLESSVPPLLEDEQLTQVVLVLDGCSDDSSSIAQRLMDGDDRIRIIDLSENIGRSDARQIGVEQLHTDIVLLLDDDVVAAPGLVAGHARAHSKAEGLVVVGYMPVATEAGVATRIYSAEYEGVCRRYEESPASILTSLWGGNVSLRTRDCLGVGIVSSYLHDQYEDTEFGLRCRDAGLVGVFDRSLLAHHHHHRSIEQFLSDAHERGAGLVSLRRRYPDAGPALGGSRLLGEPAIVEAMTTVLAPLAPASEKIAKLLRKMHMRAGARESH